MISDSAASKLRAKIRAMSPEEVQFEDGRLDQQREHEAAFRLEAARLLANELRAARAARPPVWSRWRLPARRAK